MARRDEVRVYEEQDEVRARLGELGLTPELLRDAVQQGELQRRLATPLDPPAYPGFSAWARTVRASRESLVPLGWTASDNGISTVVSPDKTIAVAVATGDEGTGQSDVPGPGTKHSRGSATVDAIRVNQQLELFEGLPAESNDDLSAALGVRQTWLLLFRSTPEGVFAELSCPKSVGSNGRIDEWSERIILGEIGGERGVVERGVSPDSGRPNDPEISVVRRT